MGRACRAVWRRGRQRSRGRQMKNTGTFRSVAATASLSLALLLTGCDGLPGVQTTSVPDAKAAHAASLSPKVDASALVEAGYLTVGLRTSSSTAPFCITSDGSQVQGLDVELAYALGDELGLRVKFVDVSDAGSSLGQSCDVVMGMKGSDTNAAVLAGSYAESAAALFRRGSTGVAKIEDLSSKKLGLQAGSVSEKTLGNTGLVVERASYSNLNEAFADLEAGKVDYVLCDAYSGAYLAKAYDDISLAGTLDAPAAVGVGVARTNSELFSAVRSALEAIQSNGIMDLERTRWVGSLESLGAGAQVRNIPEATTSAGSATGSSAGEGTDTNAAGVDGAGSNAVTM